MRQTLAVAGIAAALTFVPVTTALAESANDGRVNENDVSTWCDQGVMFDSLSGQTFTIPAPTGGTVWTKLVLNGGQDGAPEGNLRSYVLEPVPAVGVMVTRPGAAVSNAILCFEVESQSDPQIVLETTPTVAPEADVTPTVTTDVAAAGPVLPFAALASLLGGCGLVTLSRRSAGRRGVEG